LSVKRPQAILALLSLTVGAAVMAMLLNLYGGIRRKMTREFRGYGANVVLAPASSSSVTQPLPSPTGEGIKGWEGTMDQAVVNSVHQLAGQGQGVSAVPVLYGVVRLERIPPDARLPDFVNVVAVGTDLAAMIRMNPGWRESTASDYSASSLQPPCVAGTHIVSRLRIASGDAIHLQPLASIDAGGVKAAIVCHLASALTTGSPEEDQVFLPLDELQRIMGMTGRISLVQLRLDGDTRVIESSIRELSKALPGVDVRPIRQIVYAEGRVLGVIRWFLLAVTALILIIIVICLTATMTAIALERRKDIGVMKALGASDFGVMRLFLAEGAALGATGGGIGFVVGSFWALGLAHRLFGVTLNVIWWTLPLVCGLATLLALAAAAFLIGVVRAIQPAVVLKGE
jgi:putative ABC transport system permease protein